jgi:RNA polymerase sigma-70 factor (ECF subfamily)
MPPAIRSPRDRSPSLPPAPAPASVSAPAAAPAPGNAAHEEARPAGDRSGDPDPQRVASWVEGARHGDPAAFDALVQAFGPILFRVIGRLVRDPDDREDLVQDTFVRAYEALGRFHPGADFRPWLLTIALNRVRDHLRHRRRRPAHAPLVGEEGEELPLAAPDPSPAVLAEAQELRSRAERAFGRLEVEVQAILWLRVREGLEYREIAEVLGIPRGTVMSRLARARQALRTQLDLELGRPRGE